MDKKLFSIDDAFEEISNAYYKYDRDYNDADSMEEGRASAFEKADDDLNNSVMNALENLVESVKSVK